MKSKAIKFTIGSFIFFAILLYVCWLYGWFPFTYEEEKQAQNDIANLPEAPAFSSKDTILVFSPHPDDESLSCGGTISEAVAAGAQVYICWMCAGDGYELDAKLLEFKKQIKPTDTLSSLMLELGRVRLQEARNAGNALGLPADHLFLMGYGDSTLTQMFTYPDSLITSGYTKVNKGPYPNTIAFNEDYIGRRAERHVQVLIDSIRPTIVYAPAPLDSNYDHQATSFFVIKALQKTGKTNIMRNYIVHGGDYNIQTFNISEYPIPHGLHPEMALNQPLVAEDYPWWKNTLPGPCEQTKEAAIKCHVSQMEIMSGFLMAFVRTNELYALLTPAELTLPRQYYFHPEKP